MLREVNSRNTKYEIRNSSWDAKKVGTRTTEGTGRNVGLSCLDDASLIT